MVNPENGIIRMVRMGNIKNIAQAKFYSFCVFILRIYQRKKQLTLLNQL